MNNNNVDREIQDCITELGKIKLIIDQDKLRSTNQYLTKYSIIRACGSIERAYKGLICDYGNSYDIQTIGTYIYNTVKKSSMNPSYSNMINLLKKFNESWGTELKEKVDNRENSSKLRTSLESLNMVRNQFAHGGNPTITIDDIIEYYSDAIVILEDYEAVLQ
ncbi:HEPN domain-containing protein [Vallitalea guaymasensis]|uniref:RiboL-PSP-HEPN domain-containing protein n=1 Tax=Vallitalea guaymasensis TaxID=1185412 RepID=A0A8J8MEG5_9FIRM|nr:HEPN domain-containing protein [Vallitalea guaymasensis]QUH31145.1 hypothetical protein HYG85_20355 [Vallitalea guaymasensis]